MQIAGDQAAFMTILVQAIGARRALEVGTFLGYGAIAIARGLPEDGELVCLRAGAGVRRPRPGAPGAGRACGDRVEIRVAPGDRDAAGAAGLGAVRLRLHRRRQAAATPATTSSACACCARAACCCSTTCFMGGRILDPDADDEAMAVVRELNDRIAADERVDAGDAGRSPTASRSRASVEPAMAVPATDERVARAWSARACRRAGGCSPRARAARSGSAAACSRRSSPQAPDRSVFNSVFYEDAERAASLAGRARAAYERSRGQGLDRLGSRGRRRRGEGPGARRARARRGRRGTWGCRCRTCASRMASSSFEVVEREDYAELARINEIAYGYPPGDYVAVAEAPMPGLRIYFAELDGEAVSHAGGLAARLRRGRDLGRDAARGPRAGASPAG